MYICSNVLLTQFEKPCIIQWRAAYCNLIYHLFRWDLFRNNCYSYTVVEAVINRQHTFISNMYKLNVYLHVYETYAHITQNIFSKRKKSFFVLSFISVYFTELYIRFFLKTVQTTILFNKRYRSQCYNPNIKAIIYSTLHLHFWLDCWCVV